MASHRYWQKQLMSRRTATQHSYIIPNRSLIPRHSLTGYLKLFSAVKRMDPDVNQSLQSSAGKRTAWLITPLKAMSSWRRV